MSSSHAPRVLFECAQFLFPSFDHGQNVVKIYNRRRYGGEIRNLDFSVGIFKKYQFKKVPHTDKTSTSRLSQWVI